MDIFIAVYDIFCSGCGDSRDVLELKEQFVSHVILKCISGSTVSLRKCYSNVKSYIKYLIYA